MSQVSGKIDVQKQAIGAQQHSATRLLGRRIPWSLVIALCLCGLALGFNCYRLGTPSIWFDEAFSVELARQPLPMLLHITFGLEPNMELYYIFLHFWLGFTGWLGFHPTEAVVRFPSAVFAALSTGMVFLLGRRFLGLIPGILAACLYLMNDLQLVYAQQTRSYSLQLLLICLAWFALLIAMSRRERSWRWWIVYTIATTLALYAHLFTLLIILAQLAAYGVLLLLPNAWRAQTRRELLPFCLSLLASAVLSLPLLPVSRRGPENGYLPVPHFHDLVFLFQFLSGFNTLYLRVIAACCVVGVAGVLLAYLIAAIRRSVTENEGHRLHVEGWLMGRQWFPFSTAMLCWFAVPLVVSYVVSHGSIRLFSTRYLVTIIPALCLLSGIGVAVLRWRIPQALVSFVLILIALSAVPAYYASAQVEDWNAISHWIEQQYRPGDGLVCYHNGIQSGCQISVEYYLHAYPTAAHFTADTPGAFSWAMYGPADPRGVDAAVDPAALAQFGANHPRIFFIVGRVPDDAAAARAQAAQRWLDARYRLVSEITTRTVTVRLYATGDASA